MRLKPELRAKYSYPNKTIRYKELGKLDLSKLLKVIMKRGLNFDYNDLVVLA